MALEDVQRLTNAQRVAAGRVSASNDPQQWNHDGREQLIKGAELAAAGRTLGMSEEETLAAVSRQYRRQRRADDSVSQRDVLRQMVQAASTTTSEVGTPEVRGISYLNDDDVSFAFGEDVEYNYNDNKGNKITRADDEQTYRANDRGFTADEETGLPIRDTFNDSQVSQYKTTPIAIRKDGVTTTRYPGQQVYYGNPGTAPKNVLQDALNALGGAKEEESGLMRRVGRMLSGESGVNAQIDTAQDALQRHLQAEGPQDARIGRAVVRQDRENYNPEIRDLNDERAEAEAMGIRRELFSRGGRGAIADANVARVGEIHSIGRAYDESHKVRSANDAIQGQITRRSDGVYLDPVSGNPVAVQGPQLPGVLSGDRTPNNSGSSDALNAPQTARDWVVGTLPEHQRGTGDYPQVDITRETTNFANKLRQLQGYGMEGVSANIRSVDELQRVVDRVVGVSAQQGKQLYRFDPETGRNRPSSAAGAAEVMNLLRMSPNDQSRLANALFQLDAAKRSSVNQNPTGVYLSRTGEPTEGVIFDAPEPSKQGGGGPQVARIGKGSTIVTGTTEAGKPKRETITTQLAGLQGEDAQRTYMGQVEGEKPRVNRFNNTGETDATDAAIAVRKQAESRSRGKEVDAGRTRENQVKAMLAVEREKRDNTKRADKASELIAQLPPNARRVRLPGR